MTIPWVSCTPGGTNRLVTCIDLFTNIISNKLPDGWFKPPSSKTDDRPVANLLNYKITISIKFFGFKVRCELRQTVVNVDLFVHNPENSWVPTTRSMCAENVSCERSDSFCIVHS